MKVKVIQSRCICGVDYKVSKNPQEMPDAVAQDPYFKAQVANGNLLIVEEPKANADCPSDDKGDSGDQNPQGDAPQGEGQPDQPQAPKKGKKAPKAPKVEGETKYQRAKRLKAEKEAALKAAAEGNQEG